jgi:trigger factor
MNITRENIDPLNATIKIGIQKKDYEARVEAVLKDYRKKARLDGFRPGKVPSGLIKKMYGKMVLIEEVNKIISESLSKYITEENLSILGEPLPNEQEQKPIDWDHQEEFEFAFDLGLAPHIEINLSARDKIPYYAISVDKKIKASYKEEYLRKFGSFKPVEQVGEGDLLKGSIKQLDVTGEIIETGISVDETSFSLGAVKDKEMIKKWMGKEVNDTIDFDIQKAFPNDTEISSILKIDKEQVSSIGPNFRFNIAEINRFEQAEMNQDFFDRAFGKGNITSETEYDSKIEEEITAQLAKESEFRFAIDVKEKMIKKVKIDLPSAFLKRWLKAVNDDKVTEEQIEKDFEHFENDLKWQLIKDQIIKDSEIKISDEEIRNYAKEYAKMQFQQYGMSNIPDEYLTNYANEMLGKEEDARKLYGRKYEEKVIEFIREQVKLDQKKVSSDEFNKLYDEK